MEKGVKMRKMSCREMTGWLFIGISLIMIINSIRLCFCNDIWYDELFTMGMAEHSYGELVSFTARDVHPPLYYCIVKFVLDLCKLIAPSADSVIIVKLVSVMPYFLLFIYAVAFMRKRFGCFVSGMFMFCILAMPQMSAYTVEMRMYGWALFFVTAAFLHAYEIACGSGERGIGVSGSTYNAGGNTVDNDSGGNSHVSKKIIRNYVAILIYGLAAAYTQYFACVAIIMIYLYLLIISLIQYRNYKKCHEEYEKNEGNEETEIFDEIDKKNDGKRILSLKIKVWFICVAFSVAGYFPWLFVLVSQITAVRDNYWILPLTWRSLGGCVKFIMKPAFGNENLNVILAVVMFLVYIALLIAYGIYAWKMRQNIKAENVHKTQNKRNAEYIQVNATFFYALAGCLVLCGLVIFGFIASIVIRPIFVYRYMLPAMGCFWLCFVLCLDCFWQNIFNDGGDCVRMKKALYYLASPHFYIIVIVLLIGLRCYSAFMGEEKYKAGLMNETMQVLVQSFGNAGENDDIIIYNFDQLQAVCGYYTEQESYLWNAEPELLIVEMFGNKGSVWDASEIRKWLEAGRQVWFFGSFNSREDIRQEWEKEGIGTEEVGSYMLERYWFNVYRISISQDTGSMED